MENKKNHNKIASQNTNSTSKDAWSPKKEKKGTRSTSTTTVDFKEKKRKKNKLQMTENRKQAASSLVQLKLKSSLKSLLDLLGNEAPPRRTTRSLRRFVQ